MDALSEREQTEEQDADAQMSSFERSPLVVLLVDWLMGPASHRVYEEAVERGELLSEFETSWVGRMHFLREELERQLKERGIDPDEIIRAALDKMWQIDDELARDDEDEAP